MGIASVREFWEVRLMAAAEAHCCQMDSALRRKCIAA
jgi:hypothetical protein